MKTAKIAAIGAASTIAVVALLLAYPAMAATNSGYPLAGTALANTATSTSILPTPTALTVGQTLTFTSVSGQFHVIGSSEKGTAAGTVTLSVTGAFKGGYTLSIASGSLNINGTSYHDWHRLRRDGPTPGSPCGTG